MSPILQLILVLLAPFAVLGFVVAVALGPFLAGLVFSFGAAILVVVAVAVELARGVDHWVVSHHRRVPDAHAR